MFTLPSRVERSTDTVALEAAVIRPCASTVITATLVVVPSTPPYSPAVTEVSSKSNETVLPVTAVVIPVSPKNTSSSVPTVTSSFVSPSPRTPRVTEIADTLSCTTSRLAFSWVRNASALEET